MILGLLPVTYSEDVIVGGAEEASVEEAEVVVGRDPRQEVLLVLEEDCEL